MLHLLFLVPLLPFAGFAVLALGGRRLSHGGVAAVGAGSVGLATLLAIAVSLDFIARPPAGHAFDEVLWTWFAVAGLKVQVALYLDPLAVCFILIVTFVGFLIHVYSVEHMGHDDGYARFFTYMNLFVGFMLVLVLADNLLLLYLGWEGVGLCSYLLIGFWYKHWYNGYAARKAFVVTRIGDTAMIVGLFLLFTQLGTLQIQPLMAKAAATWPQGSALPVAAALLLLGGALGKSAQLPLQTWLPDAMAGPSPVSALIHAATMVTAGVYLIARTNVLFDLAPSVRTTVAVIGAATLLYAGVSALFQVDLKRILAYSTISQVGYMFLALGVGAWSAGIFMFVTHAFFKALLFLSAGVVIEAMDDEHDIFKMGGLRTRLPVAFWTFLVGAAALAALPVVTSGFYSKDLIIDRALQSTQGGFWLWIAGLVGSLLTGLYGFRAVFVVFFGPAHAEPRSGFRSGLAVRLPLFVLAGLAIVGGLIDIPRGWAHLQKLEEFLAPALPSAPLRHGGLAGALWTTFVPGVVALAGIGLAYLLYERRRQEAPEAQGSAAARYFLGGWGFDWCYRYAFELPFLWFARVSRDDLFEPPIDALARLTRTGWRALSATQNGLVRSYLFVIGLGVAVGILLVVLR
ncbi:MAG: NADH-quinone oxidoreductase subunit L [Thermoleophilia bacterium]